MSEKLQLRRLPNNISDHTRESLLEAVRRHDVSHLEVVKESSSGARVNLMSSEGRLLVWVGFALVAEELDNLIFDMDRARSVPGGGDGLGTIAIFNAVKVEVPRILRLKGAEQGKVAMLDGNLYGWTRLNELLPLADDTVRLDLDGVIEEFPYHLVRL